MIVALANSKQDDLLAVRGDTNDDNRVSVADARMLIVAIDKNYFDHLIVKIPRV